MKSYLKRLLLSTLKMMLLSSVPLCLLVRPILVGNFNLAEQDSRNRFQLSKNSSSLQLSFATDRNFNSSLQNFRPRTTPNQKQQFLDLVKAFTNAVTSLNLTYFMAGGTLVGSWRHHGFVPWDDEIDLMMNYRERMKLKVSMSFNCIAEKCNIITFTYSVLLHKTCSLTLKVLNFWIFTSYCSLKVLWSGMGEVVPARTSPTLHLPSPPTVHQLSWLAL